MMIEESPGFLINKLAHLFTERLDKRILPHGVTTSQWAILALLWQEDGLSQFELANRLGLRGATITGLINRMAASELIIRRKDAADQRLQRIFLTDKSRALESTLWASAQAVNQEALAGFSEEEKDFLMRLISRAFTNLS